MSLLADLDEFLCGPGDPVERNRHLETVAAFVRAYTRGRGFAADGTPEPEVAAVIVTATARLLANPTGTAIDGLGIVIRIKDNGTARSITFGSQYRAIGVTLPSSTTISKTLYLAMIFNNADTKWDVVAVGQDA